MSLMNLELILRCPHTVWKLLKPVFESTYLLIVISVFQLFMEINLELDVHEVCFALTVKYSSCSCSNSQPPNVCSGSISK